MNLRTTLTASAVACLLSVTVAACGDKEDTAAPAAPASSTPTSTSPATSPSSPATSPSSPDTAGDVKGAVSLRAYAKLVEKGVKKTYGNFNGAFTSVRIVPKPPHGIEFRYTYAKQVDPQAAKQTFVKLAPTLRTAFRTAVAPEMTKQVGIAHPEVTYTYLNPDGSVVWTKHYSK